MKDDSHVELVLFNFFILTWVRDTNIVLVNYLQEYQLWVLRHIQVLINLDCDIGAQRLTIPEHTEWLEDWSRFINNEVVVAAVEVSWIYNLTINLCFKVEFLAIYSTITYIINLSPEPEINRTVSSHSSLICKVNSNSITQLSNVQLLMNYIIILNNLITRHRTSLIINSCYKCIDLEKWRCSIAVESVSLQRLIVLIGHYQFYIASIL